MNTNLLTRSSAGRAVVGAALVFASAGFISSAQAQTLAVSAQINLPGSLTTSHGHILPSASAPVLFAEDNPTFGQYDTNGNYIAGTGNFDFSSAVLNNQLPSSIGVVSVSLSLYGLNTAPANPALGISTNEPDFQQDQLVLSGTDTVTGLTDSLNTLITLDGFTDVLTNGNFSYGSGVNGQAVDGNAILTLLNDTGGVITASINDLNPGFSDQFELVGGSMVLTFSVPFTPMQWLGIGLVVLMAGLRLYSVGGLKQLRMLVGV